ncbi:MAG: hypothetical protein IPN40_12400 [Uliginosibacterium sp.]|nr:hypothetical protein [Uliginosibacterium sp.]
MAFGLVGFSALALVDKELFRRGVLHRAGVLPAHAVVAHPSCLGDFSGFQCAAGRWLVDRAGGVVVLHPAQMPDMADVSHDAFDDEGGGDDAVELVRLARDVEEALGEAGVVDDAGLPAGDLAVGLQAGEIAPVGRVRRSRNPPNN